jgi:hypothetical protein
MSGRSYSTAPYRQLCSTISGAAMERAAVSETMQGLAFHGKYLLAKEPIKLRYGLRELYRPAHHVCSNLRHKASNVSTENTLGAYNCLSAR